MHTTSPSQGDRHHRANEMLTQHTIFSVRQNDRYKVRVKAFTAKGFEHKSSKGESQAAMRTMKNVFLEAYLL